MANGRLDAKVDRRIASASRDITSESVQRNWADPETIISKVIKRMHAFQTIAPVVASFV